MGLLMALGLLAGLAALGPLPAALAAGTTILVTTSNDEFNLLNPNGECSLREAIRAANSDSAVDACPAGNGADIIQLPAGVYTLTLAGANENANATGDLDITETLTLAGADQATTIIDANGLGRALHTLEPDVTLTVYNLTIRDGYADVGGGLWADGPVVISSTTFLSNTASNFGVAYGGGAFFNNGAATLTGTTFSANAANSSGSVASGGGAFFNYGAATLTGTTFLSNTANSSGSGASGGGAIFSNGAATLTGTTFLSNTANSSGDLALGGGAFFRHAATLTGATFNANTATSDSSFGRGGGAYFDDAAAVTGTTFSGNTASSGGGALFDAATTLNSTTFLSNTAGYFGGGAYFNSSAVVTASRFTANTANVYGGGAYFFGFGPTTGSFTNSLFAANVALGGRGAGLYVVNQGGDDMVTLRHTTFVSPTLGSGAAIHLAGGTLHLTNTLVASYSVGLARAGGTLTEDYSLFDSVPTPYSGTVVHGGHSLTGTAGFADSVSYRLGPTSQARDAGAGAGVSVDFEGDARPQGTGYDIGWDEAAEHKLYLPLVLRPSSPAPN